jgi:5-methylcytosine-specific restriction endonuclease McrA
VRETSPRYGAARGGGEGDRESDEEARGMERLRLRDDEPLTDEEVERLEDLAARIGERSAQLHAAEQELLEWIAEFDRLEGWKLHGHRNCVDWLVFWTGLDRRTARERLRVARALERLPRTREAMGQGRLSYSKVRAITRLGELEAADEATIVEFAEKTTAPEVEKLVRRRRDLDRPAEAERERRRHPRRKLAVISDEEGMYVVRGRLDPEVGAILMRALEAASDALYRVERQEALGPERPEPEQRRADALGLLCERALAAGFGVPGRGDGPVEPEEEGAAGSDDASGSRAEADAESGPVGPAGNQAAVDVAGDADGTGPVEPGGDPTDLSPCTCGGHPAPMLGTRPEHYQVFLYLDPDAFTSSGEPRHTHLEDGTRMSLETVRRLTCDTSVVPVLDDGTGSVLNMGRRTRTIPPAIRRALWLRDGGCRFPGCGLRFAEGHHVEHWALGGETSMENLVSLCRVHHRAVHEDGFRVETSGDGTFKFYSPEGWPLGDTPPRVRLEPGDPAAELILANRRRGARPRWDDASADFATETLIPDRLLFGAWEVLDPV